MLRREVVILVLRTATKKHTHTHINAVRLYKVEFLNVQQIST